MLTYCTHCKRWTWDWSNLVGLLVGIVVGNVIWEAVLS